MWISITIKSITTKNMSSQKLTLSEIIVIWTDRLIQRP